MRIITILLTVFLLSTPLVSAKETGDVHLYCKPKLRVYFDGELIGTTNESDSGIFIRDVSLGQHKIRLMKRGKSNEVLTFSVKDALFEVESKKYKIDKFTEGIRNSKLISEGFNSRSYYLSNVDNWEYKSKLLAESEVDDLQHKYDDLDANPFIPSIDEKYEVDSLPDRIYTTIPILPFNDSVAEQTPEFNEVWVKALIDANGEVNKAVVIAPCGNAEFDKLAINSVYNSKFIPAIKNNKRSSVWVSWSIPFVTADFDNLLSDIMSNLNAHLILNNQSVDMKKPHQKPEQLIYQDTSADNDENKIGNITVYCRPGINVYFDDKFLGKSTDKMNGFLINDVPYGTYNVKIKDRKNDIEEWDINITSRFNEIDSEKFPIKNKEKK